MERMDALPGPPWIFHRLPIAMFQTDAAGRVQHVNQHCLALLGLDAANVLGQPLVDFMTKPARSQYLQRLQGAFGRLHDVESQFVGGTGRIIDVSLSVSFEQDAAGMSDGILGAMVDLTTRRMAERAAERNAALLQSVTTHSNDAILITEAEPIEPPGPRILYANPAFTAMTGYSAEEVISRNPRILQGPRTDRRELDRLRRALKAWETVRVELVNYTKDGTEFDVEIDISPVADSSGFFTHWIAIQRNVTARRTQEAALRQAQKMEAVGQLTTGIAHDFNNLLTGISGSLELMRTRIGQGRTADLDRYIEAATASAHRAAALTHRLLAFSRRQALQPKPTDIKQLVQGMELALAQAAGPKIRIDAKLADDPWTILCDPTQLENALLNLVANARDAMPGGGHILVEAANAVLHRHPGAASLGNVPPGEYMALAITDTGAGMAPEVIARAFDPFFTTKPLGAGTGLGLSMIDGFVQQSGGHVRLRSEEGRGTTATVYLPRHLGAQAGQAAGPLAARPPNGPASAIVLVVEDEAAVRMIVLDALSDLGYTVLEAADARSGLHILESSARIDLLLTDIGLPGGMNGHQLAMAARLRRPSLKVLFITGYAGSAEEGDERMEQGMEVVAKPFEVSGLVARIQAMVGDRPSGQVQ